MMSRKTLLIDRVAVTVVALALIGGGAVAIWWWQGDSGLPERIELAEISDVVSRSWWPWASGATGVLLVLIGLRWIAAHISNQRISRLVLHGSSPTGALTINVTKAASAAADAFADTIGVRSAKGYVNRDRGQMVAHIRAIIEPEADLASVAARADEISASLAHVVGRAELRCSVELRVASRGRALSRVN